MTLPGIQDYILEVAWWIGDWSDPRFDVNDYITEESDLRRDLGLNDKEVKSLFGTTELQTVSDAMAYMPSVLPEYEDTQYKPEYPF